MIVVLWSSDSKWEIVRVCGARTPTDVKFKDSEVRLALSALDWQVRGCGSTCAVRSRGSRGQCPLQGSPRVEPPEAKFFLSMNRCVDTLWYMGRRRC